MLLFRADCVVTQMRWVARAMAEGARQRSAASLPPILKGGPLAEPKPVHQVGLASRRNSRGNPFDNPQTPEKVALGQRLFFDGRLSADGTVACGTCHDPARAFTDGRPASVGIEGRAGQRNAPTILNALYNKTQFWDGRAETFEDQAALPIVNPIEMGQPRPATPPWPQVAGIEEYQQAFREVFGRPPNGPDLAARHRRVRANAGVVRCAVRSLHRRRQQARSTTPPSAAGRSSTRRPAATNATR